MLIFLDSNIYYNNWFLRAANFNLFFNFLENTGAELLVSNLIIQECENTRERELHKAIRTIKDSFWKSNPLTGLRNVFDTEILRTPYSFKEVVAARTQNVRYIPYNDISHETVVKRALKNIKPFQESEKGYRDTLIWLSLLMYLKTAKITDDVIFISNNRKDFLRKNTVMLQQELLDDIKAAELNCTITCYRELDHFITEKVPFPLHQYSEQQVRELAIYKDERQIEVETEFYVNELNTRDFLTLVADSPFTFPSQQSLHEFTFEVHEGLEDIFLEDFRSLDSGDDIYIRAIFDLRICSVEFVIPITDYNQSHDELDRRYPDVVVEQNSVRLTRYFRPVVVAAFNFNKTTGLVRDFQVIKMTLNSRG